MLAVDAAGVPVDATGFDADTASVKRGTTGITSGTAGDSAGRAGVSRAPSGVTVDSGGASRGTGGIDDGSGGVTGDAGGVRGESARSELESGVLSHLSSRCPRFSSRCPRFSSRCSRLSPWHSHSCPRWKDHLNVSRHNPGFEDRVRAFAARLEECRKAHGLTQDEMAGELDISRKTYVLLETGRWIPHPRERHHMIHTLHKLDPAAAEAHAAIYELPVSYWGIAPVAPAAPKPLDAQQARHAYTAALYDAAEEAELPANLLRPLVAAVLAALRESGMSTEQAAEVAKEVAKRKPARASRAEGPRFRVEASDAAPEADRAERETQGRRKR